MSSSRAQQREEAAPSPVTVTRATARDAAGPIPPRLPEVPSELQDPDLFLTEQEERELRRVFRFMASFAHRAKINAELRPKLERRARLRDRMHRPDEVTLLDPMTGSAMSEEETAREFVLLAEECDGLQQQLEALEARPLECRRVGVGDVGSVLTQYGARLPRSAVEEIVWEVDESMDGQLHWDEFKHMAEVNLNDGTGLVPHRLYHVALFLMFDSEFRGIIGVDDAMEMLFTRYGKGQMESWVRALFGEAMDGDTRLSLTEFMERMDRIVEAKAERTLAKKAKGSKKESGKRRKRRPGKE